jgi:WD40 repeat protein
MGIAVDAAGNTYVADSINKRVQVLDKDGEFLRTLGDTGEWPNRLDYPYSVAVAGERVFAVEAGSYVVEYDPAGTFIDRWNPSESGDSSRQELIGIAASGDVLYVTDNYGNRVLKLTERGEVLVTWGEQGAGSGQFDYPSGIAVDHVGNVYVVDVGNKRVQIFDPTGKFLRSFATNVERNDSWPMYYGIAVASDGKIYVSDPRKGRICTFSNEGKPAGDISVGQEYEPHGLAICPDGKVAVTVRSFETHGVRKYDGRKYTQYGDFGSNGPGHFLMPTGLAVDSNHGWVYVADFWDCRIDKFSLSGELLASWGRHGTGGDEFNMIEGIGLDSEGNVYVNDSERGCVDKFDSNGKFLFRFGRSGTRNGEFQRNVGVAVDNDGYVYVTDMGRQNVQKFSPWGTFEATWGHEGTGPGEFMSPRGIGVDKDGYVYVVDETGSDVPSRVQKFNRDGSFVTSWNLDANESTGCPRLYGVAFDGAGDVYIVDSRNWTIAEFTADGVLLGEWTTELNEGGCCSGEPEAIGIDAEGNAYVDLFDTGWIMKLRLTSASPVVAASSGTASSGLPVTSASPAVASSSGSTSSALLVRTLGFVGGISSVDFSPDGRYLAAAGEVGTVYLVETENWTVVRTLEGHADYVYTVAFSPDGTMLASASGDRTIKLWDVATGAGVRTLVGHLDQVTSVAFSPDGVFLASGAGKEDATVRLWDVATGREVRVLRGHTNRVRSVAFSPDGTLLASGAFDNTAKLWDVATGQELRTLRGHTAVVRSVTFSPDGTLLASGAYDSTVKLWDVYTGQLVRTLEGHASAVFSVAFSPDGTLLATGSDDKTLKLWDVATGTVLRTLEGHVTSVTCVIFSPDGTLLASGSWSDDSSFSSTVKVWLAEEGE